MDTNDLKSEGWHVSGEGYELITNNRTVKDKRNILTNALNADIKEFGEPILSSLIKQSKTGKVVLQIQKIRNVAAPKSKEESQAAPRMLKVILTDGHTTCQAVEISNIPSLSRTHTAPGSKLLIDNASIYSSYILLESKCCTLLGGRVAAMYEKWETAKNISEHVRSSGTDGAPPWVNFGEKLISTSNEPFKSLITKTSKETTNEFDVHRQDAIAVASTGAVKKVFGGGIKVVQDNYAPNPQKYSGGRGSYDNRNSQEGGKPFTRGFRGKREMKEKVNEKPQKPPERISLFDFLENKLLVDADNNKPNSKGSDDNNFSNQEVQKTYTQRRETGRNFSDSNSSSNFQQQRHSGYNTSKSYVNNYIVHAKNNRQTTNSPRKENFTNNSSATDSVESVTRNLEKMSVNSQFASRSLQQHLNLGSNRNEFTKPKANSSPGGWNWKVGDLCMAKYWEDGKYYNASITNLTERTCVVKFNGYGNVEEVLKVDCIPISDHESDLHFNTSSNNKGGTGYRFSRRPHYSNNRPFNE